MVSYPDIEEPDFRIAFAQLGHLLHEGADVRRRHVEVERGAVSPVFQHDPFGGVVPRLADLVEPRTLFLTGRCNEGQQLPPQFLILAGAGTEYCDNRK